MKKNIHSVLHSYVGWYDPFAELVQNAVDSVEKRSLESASSFKKQVSIIIDLQSNRITVSDNGVGLDEPTFKQFLAPNESFKDLDSRGSKGVGATYVAYGFNYLRVDTKTKNFTASGEMRNARRWLKSDNSASNPLVHPIDEPYLDEEFAKFDSGVSVTVELDDTTKPRDLSWPGLETAEAWFNALCARTALGAIVKEIDLHGRVVCITRDGSLSEFKFTQIKYLSPHAHLGRCKSYEQIVEMHARRVKQLGTGAKMPVAFQNLEAAFLRWGAEKILAELPNLTESSAELVKRHNVILEASYLYGTTAWKQINKQIGCRANANVYGPGIQLATDNMAQGELIQIPLTKYTGRQNQAHVLMHFEGAEIDLGRKGFDKEVVDAAKEVSSRIVRDVFSKIRSTLKSDDLKTDDIIQGEKLDQWKKMLTEHEGNRPLTFQSEHFFKPINEISISAEPTREQDVIALFNQLIAGGVIRGIRILGTNEMMIYDGAYRIVVGPKFSDHEFSAEDNPLGITSSRCTNFEDQSPDGFLSGSVKILEYKYTLDGLISDLSTGDKIRDDIDLVVCWEAGARFTEMFEIQSLLSEDGVENRPYHGVTHILIDENQKPAMYAIILKDLIGYLVDPVSELEHQEKAYVS